MDPTIRVQPLETVKGCTFLVLPGGECIPVDGPFEVQRHRGDYFLLGHHSWERWASRTQAERRLEECIRSRDPHEVAARSLEGLGVSESNDVDFGAI